MLRRILAGALFVGLFAFAWSFAKHNADVVDVYYGLGTAQGVGVGELIASVFAGGVLIGCVTMLVPYLRARLLGRRYRKQVERLETEVHELRNLPLSGGSALTSEAEYAEEGSGLVSGEGAS